MSEFRLLREVRRPDFQIYPACADLSLYGHVTHSNLNRLYEITSVGTTVKKVDLSADGMNLWSAYSIIG
ncbi:MAG: hypothetical protein ACE5D7_07180, partial [Fidelibacterota bacterium]